MESPISTHYFTTLTREQRLELSVPPSTPADWYLYHIDMYKANAEARRAYFQLTMSLLLQGGIYVISSPIEYYQQVVTSLGFKEVPGAAHTDYGPEYPSPTFSLDLMGMKLKQYIEGLIERTWVKGKTELVKKLLSM